MESVLIASAVRTPIGKFGGTLAQFSAADLGVIAVKAALERAGIEPEAVGETIIGQAQPEGRCPQNVSDKAKAFSVPRIQVRARAGRENHFHHG